ncbi:hypothetical protein ACTXT7_016754, partial [Hymenolepis weldensis]
VHSMCSIARSDVKKSQFLTSMMGSGIGVSHKSCSRIPPLKCYSRHYTDRTNDCMAIAARNSLGRRWENVVHGIWEINVSTHFKKSSDATRIELDVSVEDDILKCCVSITSVFDRT